MRSHCPHSVVCNPRQQRNNALKICELKVGREIPLTLRFEMYDRYIR